jgi:hypothetical protein
MNSKSIRKDLAPIIASGFLAVPAIADPVADQIERANLLRELSELKPSPGHGLPAAAIELHPTRAEQFAESQWRNLLGSQQSQANSPQAQGSPESQWRGQSYDRERRAEELSADILQRSRDYLKGRR